MVAPPPVMPGIAARPVVAGEAFPNTSRGPTRKAPLITSMQARTATSATCPDTTGQIPAREPARFSPTNSRAKPVPATSPYATPAQVPRRSGREAAGPEAAPGREARTRREARSGGGARCGREGWPATRGAEGSVAGMSGCSPGPGGEADSDTSTIAGRATTIPVRESEGGRSPSNTPARTDSPAALTALSGAATLNAARRNPAYRASAPAMPPRPAATPQPSAAADGTRVTTQGSTTRVRTRLHTVARKLTKSAPALRAASPAAKSEAP